MKSTGINRIEEIIKLSVLFPFNVNLKIPTDGNYNEYIFDIDIFYEKSTLELIKDAFQHAAIWKRAVRITEQGEFGAPLFILRKIEGKQRVGLFFDHGKVLKMIKLLFCAQTIELTFTIQITPQFLLR